MSKPNLSTEQLLNMNCSIPGCDEEWDWTLKAKTDTVLVFFCEPHFKAYWEDKLPNSKSPLEVVKYS